jgi:hypothetical protein
VFTRQGSTCALRVASTAHFYLHTAEKLRTKDPALARLPALGEEVSEKPRSFGGAETRRVAACRVPSMGRI